MKKTEIRAFFHHHLPRHRCCRRSAPSIGRRFCTTWRLRIEEVRGAHHDSNEIHKPGCTVVTVLSPAGLPTRQSHNKETGLILNISQYSTADTKEAALNHRAEAVALEIEAPFATIYHRHDTEIQEASSTAKAVAPAMPATAIVSAMVASSERRAHARAVASLTSEGRHPSTITAIPRLATPRSPSRRLMRRASPPNFAKYLKL